MTTFAVRLLSTNVTRGGSAVVSQIDLDIEPGEWVGLVGPNGAGKSTLLDGIAGLAASTGTVRLFGDDVSRLSARQRARRVAMVPQHPTLPVGMSVIDYVVLGRAAHSGRFGAESSSDVLAANAALEALDLAVHSKRSVDSLSGGERQRVVLARALAQAAPLLLLDEPTSALDVGVQTDVLEHIDAIRRKRGLTVVSAIHDLTVAAQYCDRLVMLSGGRVVADGSAAGVLTAETIGRHYGARVKILTDPEDGLIIIPIRSKAASIADLTEESHG